jgi:hypothetical protein
MEPESSLPRPQEPSSQNNPAHTTPSYLSNIHFSIMKSPMPLSS